MRRDTTHVIAPRIGGGGVSAWYIGTEAESAPTPRPAAARRRLCSFGFRSDLHYAAGTEDEAL